MIIKNQGVEISIPDNAQWQQFTDGANNCIQVLGVTLPAEHPKYGMTQGGKALAFRDSMDPEGGVQFYTPTEVKFFSRGVESGAFNDIL